MTGSAVATGLSKPAALWGVVPVFNEAPTIGEVVRRLRRHCAVIVVDDASTDDSAGPARVAGAACVLRHPERLGKAAALRTGFAEALLRGAEWVATLDGDGQHDPDDLPALVEAAAAWPGALVVGDRLARGGGDRIPPLRRAAIRMADRLVAQLTGAVIRDTQCGFRVYPATLLRAAPLREDGFVLETEVLVGAVQAGHPLVSVPIRCLYPVGRRGRFRALADGRRIAGYLLRELWRARARKPPRVLGETAPDLVQRSVGPAGDF